MTDIKRLGLGCMGMNMSNKERSIETIRYALRSGVTLLNTGEFREIEEKAELELKHTTLADCMKKMQIEIDEEKAQ